MVPLALSFAAMIGLYLAAMKATTAANAIFLQYTAPFWIVPLGLIFLHERPTAARCWGIGLATLGVVAIVGYGVRPGEGRGVRSRLGERRGVRRGGRLDPAASAGSIRSG